MDELQRFILYLDPSNMPISEMLLQDKILHKLLRAATVLNGYSVDGSGVESGPGYYYVNLLVDLVIEDTHPIKLAMIITNFSIHLVLKLKKTVLMKL